MSGVFLNIDPHPPHLPARVYPAFGAGREGGGGSIFWKTPGTALYSTYVSTLWYPYPSEVGRSLGSGCSFSQPAKNKSYVIIILCNI
jgi:hypothetical protein